MYSRFTFTLILEGAVAPLGYATDQHSSGHISSEPVTYYYYKLTLSTITFTICLQLCILHIDIIQLHKKSFENVFHTTYNLLSCWLNIRCYLFFFYYSFELDTLYDVLHLLCTCYEMMNDIYETISSISYINELFFMIIDYIKVNFYFLITCFVYFADLTNLRLLFISGAIHITFDM